MDAITLRILHYQKTGRGLEDLVQEAGLIVYEYLRTKTGAKEDERSDFFCFFYPKIPTLIRRFTYRGSTFKSYLLISAKWQLKSFITKKKRQKKLERFFEYEYHKEIQKNYEAKSFLAAESTLPLDRYAQKFFKIDAAGLIAHPASKRRLLLLTFKNSYAMNYEIAVSVALVTGYRKEWVLNCMQKLRETMQERLCRIEVLRMKRNRYYKKLWEIYIDLSAETDAKRRHELYRKLKLVKRNMYEAIEEISKIPSAPTHQEISNLLNIPKGTVDSCLYYLKTTMEQLVYSDVKCA